jgi:hypothetical protein
MDRMWPIRDTPTISLQWIWRWSAMSLVMALVVRDLVYAPPHSAHLKITIFLIKLFRNIQLLNIVSTNEENN